MKQVVNEIKNSSCKYKVIYKCRLCGKEFEREVYDVGDCRYPTSCIHRQHICNDGRYGLGDLLRSYEINKCQ